MSTQFDEKEKKYIEEKAQCFLNDSKYSGEEPVNIIKLAQNIGFTVGNAALISDSDGFIVVKDNYTPLYGVPTNKLIGVNSQRTIEWKKFIIAHEIGHYYLSDVNKGNALFAHREHRKGKDKAENAADYFASNVIMPKETFEKEFESLKDNNLDMADKVAILASRFKVTEEMAKRRIEELELWNNGS